MYIASDLYFGRETITSCRITNFGYFPHLTICYDNMNTDGNITTAIERITSKRGQHVIYDRQEFIKHGAECSHYRFARNAQIPRLTVAVRTNLSVAFYLTSFYKYPYETESLPIVLRATQCTVKYKFSRIQVTLLPAPYVTNCINYSAINLEGRGQCFEHCLAKLTNRTYFKFKTKADVINTTYSQSFTAQHYYNQCLKKCSNSACISETFFSYDMSIVHYNPALNLTMYKFEEQYPSIVMIHQPSFPFAVYLIYII